MNRIKLIYPGNDGDVITEADAQYVPENAREENCRCRCHCNILFLMPIRTRADGEKRNWFITSVKFQALTPLYLAMLTRFPVKIFADIPKKELISQVKWCSGGNTPAWGDHLVVVDFVVMTAVNSR